MPQTSLKATTIVYPLPVTSADDLYLQVLDSPLWIPVERLPEQWNTFCTQTNTVQANEATGHALLAITHEQSVHEHFLALHNEYAFLSFTWPTHVYGYQQMLDTLGQAHEQWHQAFCALQRHCFAVQHSIAEDAAQELNLFLDDTLEQNLRVYALATQIAQLQVVHYRESLAIQEEYTASQRDAH